MTRPRSAGLGAGLLFAALLAGCASVPPPTAALDLADRAVREADDLQPRGPAQQALAEARQRLALARDAAQRGRNAEALAAAQEAEAAATHAAAEARRAALEAEVDSKAARNADLRRRLLIQGG
jgi:hypothetical protein